MNSEALAAALKHANLAYSAQHIKEHLDVAEKQKYSYTQFLAHLLEQELHHRRQRRIAQRLRQSKLRVQKTIESYDFSFPDKINTKLVKALFDLHFITEKKNVILIGPPGVGSRILLPPCVFTPV
jgi:DNA replication protein DnaC